MTITKVRKEAIIGGSIAAAAGGLFGASIATQTWLTAVISAVLVASSVVYQTVVIDWSYWHGRAEQAEQFSQMMDELKHGRGDEQ